jgi:transcriptional regulator with XRE-family HTH domain
MAKPKELLRLLNEFRNSADGAGHQLRLDLADLVIAKLREKGWTQKQLADATGMKESFVTRIIHSNSNCTFGVAGRILFALDVKATLTTKAARKKDSELVSKPGKSQKASLSRKVA